MASITIMANHRNLLFAAEIANDTGAEFSEEGQWITISDNPELSIPHYVFSGVFDPNGRRSDDPQLERAWRSLLLNKRGFLKYFGDDEIIISDEDPKEKGRPQFLLRFRSEDERAEVEEWATRAGFENLTAYILEAVNAFNDYWRKHSGPDASNPLQEALALAESPTVGEDTLPRIAALLRQIT